MTSQPVAWRMRRMMLIDASCPSNRLAAVTKRTLASGLYTSGCRVERSVIEDLLEGSTPRPRGRRRAQERSLPERARPRPAPATIADGRRYRACRLRKRQRWMQRTGVGHNAAARARRHFRHGVLSHRPSTPPSLAMPTFLRGFRSLLPILAFLPAAAFAALPPGVSKTASVEGVDEYAFANGLKVLLFVDPTKPTTTVDVTYKVGSRQENYGETGMAHLLEHMLFKGTPSLPSVFSEFSRRGMQFNANTSYDRTTYFETFAASPATLDFVLKIEAERMTRSTFSKTELDSEMTVLRNEYESGENRPQSVLWKRMAAVAFDWHNYGKPTIGARSDIENVPFERLRAYYRMYYQPDNAVLTIAGKFDAERTLALVARHFGALPKPARTLPKLYTVEPAQDGERSVTVRRVASTQWLGAMFHLPQGANPDATAFEALSEIMTVAPAGRLYKALIEGKKASAVENWTFAQHDAGFVIFWAQVPLGDSMDAARDTMLATLYDVAAHPVTAAELDRVRTKAQKDFDETINDPERLAVAFADAI